ncbi:hypothetical protein BZG06_07005 [Salinivibrio kushneri]|uniref:diguanylate cyclase n=1 Tax=Salinivibrio kushneri TaxID=1908198 RepID=A0AB36K483_9GAMM|nr:GGDEF domain-containing protein [Salinivibrio kushneri]OOE42819.1 hypothetical protein BZG09_12425 [Salinivibrio kushneri]OOE45886.1 hypothetical protein BZG06_07005 [Salinivibrio kushneri]
MLLGSSLPAARHILLWSLIYGAIVWLDMRYLSAILDINTVTLLNISSGLAVVLFRHLGLGLLLPLILAGSLGHGLAAVTRIESLHLATGLFFGIFLTLTSALSAWLWQKYYPHCLDTVRALFRFVLVGCLLPAIAMMAIVAIPLYIDEQLVHGRLQFLTIEFTMTYTTSTLLWVSLYTAWQRQGFDWPTLRWQNVAYVAAIMALTLISFSVFPGAIYIELALLIYIAFSGHWRTLLVGLCGLIIVSILRVPFDMGAFAIPDLYDGVLALLIFIFTTVLASISISIQVMEYKNAVAARDSWQRKASLDPLTGTVNRYGLLPELAIEYERSRRARYTYTVAVIDVDNFKQFNDTYGHSAGDRVLQDVAAEITRAVRQTDLVARYGGEEFVIIFRNTDSHDAYYVAERIRQRIATNTSQFDNQSLTYTVSCGLSESCPNDSHPEQVFDRADDHLYTAKSLGRNLVVVAPKEDP